MAFYVGNFSFDILSRPDASTWMLNCSWNSGIFNRGFKCYRYHFVEILLPDEIK